MRITVLLDSFDCLDSSAFAIVWVDTETEKWSRESHHGVNLPTWGGWSITRGGVTLFEGETPQKTICTLEAFQLATDCPRENDIGRARWHIHTDGTTFIGRWQVQYVDKSETHPEESLFADGV